MTFGADDALPLGAVVHDRYRVVNIVGRGGVGTVYQVNDILFGKNNSYAQKKLIDQSEGARKQYAITDEGAKALAENKEMVDALFARIDHLRQEYARQRPQQIERAVENLRMALRMKMGSLTTEQIHAVTDIIDNAAKQIERIG